MKKEKHLKTKESKYGLLVIGLIVIAIFSGCAIKQFSTTGNDKPDMNIQETICLSNNPIEEIVVPEFTIMETEPIATEPVVHTATIGAMGDLLIHSPIFNGIVKQSDGTYNFDSVFKYVCDEVSALDYTVINLETTLCGTDNGYPFKGYPKFNCPDSIIDSVKTAGFDMLLTANNHSYDTELVGYKRTLDVIYNAGLSSIGTYSNSDEIKWSIQNVNGINFGMLCYTYAFNVTNDGRPSLNGNPPIKEEGLCNYFDYNNLDAFYVEVEKYISEMNQESDVIIMFIHWGEEYQLSANEYQKEIAQKLCDMGVDVIIGGHPHVIQPIELLESNLDSSHKTICIYSVGNAVSNQRLGHISYVKTAHTEDGILFSVTVEKVAGGRVYIKDVNIIPTWVYMHNNNGKKEYNIIPLRIESEDNWKEMFGFGNSTLQKAKDSYQRTIDVVGNGLNNVKEYLYIQQYGVG